MTFSSKTVAGLLTVVFVANGYGCDCIGRKGELRRGVAPLQG